jgi:acetate kinase
VTDAILVLNAGSSSLKFSAFEAGAESRPVCRGQVEGLGVAPRFVLRGGDGTLIEEQKPSAGPDFDHERALGLVLERCKARFGDYGLAAVGHRVVHGGVKFTGPVAVTSQVLAELEELTPLAPLHQPHNLAAIRAVAKTAPHLPQAACFDTAFHRTQPPVAQRFGLPRRYTDAGVIRYGFHGLSYEYIASVLPRFDPGSASGRTIVAHLGNGASLCALQCGKSVATTMSFTPVDGLVMGTRVGSLDPAAVLHLMTRHGMKPADVERLIYHESGLIGVSGTSSDMRELLSSDNPHAAEAIDLFVYRIAREVGSLAAALGGLDAVVFTAGIGENSPVIRARICQAATWLGLELDDASNNRGGPRISRPESRITAWVIPTNEELMIVQHTRQVLGMT